MKGFFQGLTPEQQKAALEYRGEENHGEELTPDQIAWLRERAEATRKRWTEHAAAQKS